MLNLCLHQHRRMLNYPANAWQYSKYIKPKSCWPVWQKWFFWQTSFGLWILSMWLNHCLIENCTWETGNWPCTKLMFKASFCFLFFGPPLWFSKYVYIALQLQTTILQFIVFEKHSGSKNTGHIWTGYVAWSFQYTYVLRNYLFSCKWTQ